MSFEQADKRKILSQVLPLIPSIAKAKGLSDLEDEAEKIGVKFETLLEREYGKEYKAVDHLTGTVYIVYNPVTWTYRDEKGERFFHRKPPRQIYTYEEAKKAAKETPTIEFNAKSSWEE